MPFGIPNTYDLPGELQFVHNDYLLYFDLLADLKAQDKSIENAGQGQIDTLLLLAAYDQTNPGIYARNALIAGKHSYYVEPYLLPGSLKSLNVEDFPIELVEADEYLKVFPNPAKEYIIIEYAIDENHNVKSNHFVNITVFSAEGKAVASREIQHAQDQIIISTRDWNPGTYICKLNDWHNSSKIIKFTVVK